MPKYRIYLQTIASTSVEVEADDKEAALEAACDQELPTLCAQCSGWGRSVSLDLSDDWTADHFTVQTASLDESVVEVEA